mgnify:CR=1 FL=1
MEYIIIAVVAVAVVYFGFIKKDESKPASGGHGKPSAPRTPPALKVAKKKPAPKKTVAKKTAPKKVLFYMGAIGFLLLAFGFWD